MNESNPWHHGSAVYFVITHCVCVLSVFLLVYIISCIGNTWPEASIVSIDGFIFRVTLDMLSVQSNNDIPWSAKKPQAFWRGRDSRRERLDLIDLARAHPHLFNASLTNFFFFKEEEEQYGPKEKHISFFNFFDVNHYPLSVS